MAAQGPGCMKYFSNSNFLVFFLPPETEREIAHAHTKEMETPAECAGYTVCAQIHHTYWREAAAYPSSTRMS